MTKTQLWVGIYGLLSIGVAMIVWMAVHNPPPEKLTVRNQFKQEASLDYEQIVYLNRMIKHDGLTKEEIGRMYSLKYKPIANEVVKDKPFEMQCLNALKNKKYVELDEGLWELTYEGKKAVE